ncbi:MAG: esterase family protein [Phycisphaerae bacterium]|nr:esterase family protein [Phycisphaerae bacterium]
MRLRATTILCLFSMLVLAAPVRGQDAPARDPGKKKAARQRAKARPFSWVNPLPKRSGQPGLPVRHGTFKSPSMKIEVGYCIYLPPKYEEAGGAGQRYPVVYYLHGGRPGSETKSVGLSTFVDRAIRTGKVRPMIYVFVNGGPVSHYNYPQINDGQGEDIFIQELIPHIDRTYRTMAGRSGRAIEGFSQGGRGTTRIMFRHPHLFCSAAPGGAGHATEKRISEQNGRESDSLIFAPGYNTYDLARAYASGRRDARRGLRILIHVGTKGFNYQNNLAYMAFLESLEIPFERLVVEDAPHSAKVIYEKSGLQIMRFHADSFQMAAANK